MGSCVSVHKDAESGLEPNLSVGSKNEKILIPSPVKQKPDTVNGGDHSVADFAVKSQLSAPRFRDDGSKEEAFFDSHPWLESDCEDDFLSVNGDFTPSRGSTPVHHNFSSGNPAANKATAMEGILSSALESSPTGKKKRLAELFKESLRRQLEDDEDEASDESVVLDNVSSNGRTPNGAFRAEEKSEKTTQCCIPRLRSSGSISEKKKKVSPPSGTD